MTPLEHHTPPFEASPQILLYSERVMLSFFAVPDKGEEISESWSNTLEAPNCPAPRARSHPRHAVWPGRRV